MLAGFDPLTEALQLVAGLDDRVRPLRRAGAIGYGAFQRHRDDAEQRVVATFGFSQFAFQKYVHVMTTCCGNLRR